MIDNILLNVLLLLEIYKSISIFNNINITNLVIFLVEIFCYVFITFA